MDPTLSTIDSVPNDTHPTVQASLIEGYRKMSSAQKPSSVFVRQSWRAACSSSR